MDQHYYDLPKGVADASLPLPNVYFATVVHTGGTYTFYVAADHSKAAVAKLRRLCSDRYGFRPYRSTTDIKVRRFLLGDYLDNPQGLQCAVETAEELGERSTMEALNGRMAEVQRMIDTANSGGVDFDAVADSLAAELIAAEGSA